VPGQQQRVAQDLMPVLHHPQTHTVSTHTSDGHIQHTFEIAFLHSCGDVNPMALHSAPALLL
jgi:hypothetical protein